jgi:hypothetical protein
MQREKKKTPTDYPQFAFRIKAEDKERLNRLIDEAKRRMNVGRADDEKVINKNDVIVAALALGLKQLKRK